MRKGIEEGLIKGMVSATVTYGLDKAGVDGIGGAVAARAISGAIEVSLDGDPGTTLLQGASDAVMTSAKNILDFERYRGGSFSGTLDALNQVSTFNDVVNAQGMEKALEQYAMSVFQEDTIESMVRSAGSVENFLRQKKQSNEVEIIDYNGMKAKFLELTEDDYLIYGEDETEFFARKMGDYYEEGEFGVSEEGRVGLKNGTRTVIGEDGSYSTDWVRDGEAWIRRYYRADGESVLIAVDPYKQKPLTSAEVFDEGLFSGVIADEGAGVLEVYEDGKLVERRTRVETLAIQQSESEQYVLVRDNQGGYFSQKLDEHGKVLEESLRLGQDITAEIVPGSKEEVWKQLEEVMNPPNDPSDIMRMLNPMQVPGSDFRPEMERLGVKFPTGPVGGGVAGGPGTIGYLVVGPDGVTVGAVLMGNPAQGTSITGGAKKLDEENDNNNEPPVFWKKIKDWHKGLSKPTEPAAETGDQWVRVVSKDVAEKIKQKGTLDPKDSRDGYTWVTKEKYIEGKTGKELETILYNKELQPLLRGEFTTKGGAVKITFKRPPDARYRGLTNRTDGVPQWNTTEVFTIDDLEFEEIP